MKIAIISNWQDERCAVRVYGQQLADALTRAGHMVLPVRWDDTRAINVNRVIFNWHPMTAPPRVVDLPHRALASVILHDVPPHCTLPVDPAAIDCWSAIPWTGVRYLPHPASPYTPAAFLGNERFTVGTSGVRGDGVDLLKQVCEANAWVFSGSPEDHFASIEDEIARLSTCDVNVLWYWASGRGRSSALLTLAAARRPILTTTSTMFNQAADMGISGAIYQTPWSADLAHLAGAIRNVRTLGRSPEALAAWDFHKAAALLLDSWRSR